MLSNNLRFIIVVSAMLAVSVASFIEGRLEMMVQELHRHIYIEFSVMTSIDNAHPSFT